MHIYTNIVNCVGTSTDGTRRTTARVKVPSSNPGEATLVSGPCGCPGPNKQMTSQQGLTDSLGFNSSTIID